MSSSADIRVLTQIGPSLYLMVLRVPATAGFPEIDTLVVPTVLENGQLRRAAPGDGAAEALLAALANGDGPYLAGLVVERFPLAPAAAGERFLPVDQTHESVVVGEVAVVKWQVSAAPTPAPRLVAHLAANNFTRMPRPWGFVSWNSGDADVLVASVADFLPGARDGWEWMVSDVARYATGAQSLDDALAPANEIARLVAEMHAALARPSGVVAEPQRTATGEEQGRWIQHGRATLRDALQCVEGEAAKLLNSRKGEIERCFEAIRDSRRPTVIPVHGDLHVGQILRWDRGYAVNDFDGNPVIPPDERMVPQPAARDVAGMLQSLDHVGRVVLRRTEGAAPERVIEWMAQSQELFLASYRAHLKAQGFSRLLDEELLFPFRVEQECREFVYAHRHLPRWGYVPAGAIESLLP